MEHSLNKLQKTARSIGASLLIAMACVPAPLSAERVFHHYDGLDRLDRVVGVNPVLANAPTMRLTPPTIFNVPADAVRQVGGRLVLPTTAHQIGTLTAVQISFQQRTHPAPTAAGTPKNFVAPPRLAARPTINPAGAEITPLPTAPISPATLKIK